MQKNSMKRITRGAASTAICAALALGTVGVASAHDAKHSHHDAQKSRSDHHSNRRHDHKIDGVVTALGTYSVTIQSRNDTPVAYTTTSTTTYTVGKETATVAALALGENVDLVLSTTTPQTVTAVEVDLANVHGLVSAINGNVITIGTGTDAMTVTVSATTTYTLNDAASTLSAIILGSRIEARGVATSSSALNAASVKIEVPNLDTHVEGTITALGTSSVTLQSRNGTPVAYTTTSATTYALGKTALTVAALAIGEHVEMTLTSTTPQTVTAIEINLAHIEGKVSAINGNTITVGVGTDTRTITVSATTVYTLHGAVSALGALVVGSHIEARGVWTSSSAMNASSVHINFGR